jgi:hypothetical protein
VEEGELHPSVVQQLMFNRILACVRLLAIDHVSIARFDAKTGIIEGSLAGVNFVVNVNTVSSPNS